MVSQFYQRKRRLAYIFAALSLVLLAGEYYLSTLIDIYSHPRVVAGSGGVTVLHRSQRPMEREGFRLIPLDSELNPLREPYRSSGDARAVLRDKDGLTTFFANRYAVIRGGETVQSASITFPSASEEQGEKKPKKTWEVQAAVLDPGRGQAWIFGWSDKTIVSRQRISGAFSWPPKEVAASAYVNGMTASMDGTEGPLVAWREEGSGTISTALYDGTSFEPGESFDIGKVQHWDALRFDGRTVVVTYRRNDRTFKTITLRLQCCPCDKTPLPEEVVFEDAVVLLGKRVTGIAAAAQGGRLIVAVTRWTTAQCGVVPFPLADSTPAPLRPLAPQPMWRHAVAWFTPALMLFFSFSLVFLGFTLLREKGLFVLEMFARPEEEGPRPAEILQRAMAYILDLIVIFPVLFVCSEVLNVSPASNRLDLADPKLQSLVGLTFLLRFLYYFIGDVFFGRSLGKKIIGIRVVEQDGSRLSFRGALIRNLLRPIDAEFPMFFFGVYVMAASKRRQRLGDRLARTMVVQDERGPEGEEDAVVSPDGQSVKRRN